MGRNATQMDGRNYYGILDTCEIKVCAIGYQLYNGVCRSCPAGSFCDGTGDGTGGAQMCSALGDGSWNISVSPADSETDCRKNCPDYSVGYGTATAINDSEFYPNNCEYTCISETGNTGEIVGGTCVESSCKSDMEMIGGVCEMCDRENALTYVSGENCEIRTCESGYHSTGDACVSNVIECTAPNAETAYQTWNGSGYGVCTIETCDGGYHLESNSCLINEQNCTVENGYGYHEWDEANNKWGECVVEYCEPGFTTDPRDTNEQSKPCGACKNKFGINGDLAVSSYVDGCEIAACMYQNELYNLENNECMPICDINGYEDETGTMKWNRSTKKCDRICNEGFTTW
jgi:hypothetical protein